MTAPQQLATAIWEADRHVAVLQDALRDWRAKPWVALSDLDDNRATLRLVDQILFRFAKLQDAVGQRLIPATLAVLNEPYEDWPMRDRLDRLEKLGYLEVDQWLRWRETRNRLAHEYPDRPEVRFAAINAAIEAAGSLAHCYEAWRHKLNDQGYSGF